MAELLIAILTSRSILSLMAFAVLCASFFIALIFAPIASVLIALGRCCFQSSLHFLLLMALPSKFDVFGPVFMLVKGGSDTPNPVLHHWVTCVTP